MSWHPFAKTSFFLYSCELQISSKMLVFLCMSMVWGCVCMLWVICMGVWVCVRTRACACCAACDELARCVLSCFKLNILIYYRLLAQS